MCTRSEPSTLLQYVPWKRGGESQSQCLVPTERYCWNDWAINITECHIQRLPVTIERHLMLVEVQQNAHGIALLEEVVLSPEGLDPEMQRAARGELLGNAAGQAPGAVADRASLDSNHPVRPRGETTKAKALIKEDNESSVNRSHGMGMRPEHLSKFSF